MKKRKFLKRVVYIAALLVLIGLESCISLYSGRSTVIDTGGAIANIGQEQARCRAELLPQKQGTKTHAIHYRVWKKGEQYIVQLPVSYAPARYTVISHSCGHDSYRKNTLRFSNPRYYYSDEELDQYPVEYFYATLSEKQYLRLCRPNKAIKSTSERAPFHGVTICSAAEMDLRGAEPVLDRHGKHVAVQTNVKSPDLDFWWVPHRHLPPRRTWYNQCLRPISWVAEVVDIPLSLIATPIGWVVDAIYEPLAN